MLVVPIVMVEASDAALATVVDISTNKIGTAG